MSDYFVPDKYKELNYPDLIHELDTANHFLEQKISDEQYENGVQNFYQILIKLEKNAEALCIYSEYVKNQETIEHPRFSSDDLLVISARLYQKTLEIIEDAQKKGISISQENIFRYQLYSALSFFACRRHAISAAISRKMEEEIKGISSDSSEIELRSFYEIIISLMKLEYDTCDKRCALELDQIKQKITTIDEVYSGSSIILPFLGVGIQSIQKFTHSITKGDLEEAKKSVNKLRDQGIIFDKFGYTELSYVFFKLSFSIKHLIDFSIWHLREILPYSSKDNQDKVNIFIQEKISEGKFFLFNSQYKALFEDKILSKEHHQILSMPTGAGKTLLAQLLLFKELLKRKDPSSKVIYIVPTRVLAHEKLKEFEEIFLSNGLNYSVCKMTGEIILESSDVVKNNDILIMTQEKFDMLMRENFFDYPISTVISDEFHNVFQNYRGLRLQLSLVRFKQNKKNRESKIFLISAILPKIDQENISRWLYPDDNTKSVVFETDWQPTFTRRGYFDFLKEVKSSKWDIHFNDGITLKIDAPQSTLKSNAISQAAAYIAVQLCQFDQVYLYSHEKQGLFSKANNALIFLEDISIPYVNLDKRAEYLKKIKRIIGTHKFTELFEAGVAIHYGSLPLVIRGIVEDAIKEKAVPIVIATSTLAQGVNLPVKTIIISKPQLGREIMDFGSFLNLIGRAGRPYKTEEGQIILLNSPIHKGRHSFTLEEIQKYLDIQSSNIPENVSPILLLKKLEAEGKTNSKDYLSLNGVFESLMLAVIAEELFDDIANEDMIDAITFSSKQMDFRNFTADLLKDCESRFIESYGVAIREDNKIKISKKGWIIYQSGFSPASSLTSINWLKINNSLLREFTRIKYDVTVFEFGAIWRSLLIQLFSTTEGQQIFGERVEEPWIWGSLSWIRGEKIEIIASRGYHGDILEALSDMEGNLTGFIAWGLYAMSKWVKLSEYQYSHEMEKQLINLANFVWYGANSPLVIRMMKEDTSRHILRDDAIILARYIEEEKLPNFIGNPTHLQNKKVQQFITKIPEFKIEGNDVLKSLKLIYKIE
jgi:superfamily II DNA/RNA helicase